MKALTLRLPDDTWEKLRQVAFHSKLSKTELIRSALNRHLRTLEWMIAPKEGKNDKKKKS